MKLKQAQAMVRNNRSPFLYVHRDRCYRWMWLVDWQLCRDSARIVNIILHMYVYFWIWAFDVQWFSFLLSAPSFGR